MVDESGETKGGDVECVTCVIELFSEKLFTIPCGESKLNLAGLPSSPSFFSGHCSRGGGMAISPSIRLPPTSSIKLQHFLIRHRVLFFFFRGKKPNQVVMQPLVESFPNFQQTSLTLFSHLCVSGRTAVFSLSSFIHCFPVRRPLKLFFLASHVNRPPMRLPGEMAKRVVRYSRRSE